MERTETSGDYPSLSVWSSSVAENRFTVHYPSRQLPPGTRGSAVTCYGQQFVWSELHWSAAELERLRLMGDAPIDDVLDELGVKPGEDALHALEVSASASPHGKAARLLADASRVPEWVDWELIARGQLVFCRCTHTWLEPTAVVVVVLLLGCDGMVGFCSLVAGLSHDSADLPAASLVLFNVSLVRDRHSSN
jgi:hypothetical protein